MFGEKARKNECVVNSRGMERCVFLLDTRLSIYLGLTNLLL